MKFQFHTSILSSLSYFCFYFSSIVTQTSASAITSPRPDSELINKDHDAQPTPTLYIAGDSTAAKDDGSPELLGWGEKIGQYLSIPVVNDAIAGATTRTYTEDGNCAFFKFFFFFSLIINLNPNDFMDLDLDMIEQYKSICSHGHRERGAAFGHRRHRVWA